MHFALQPGPIHGVMQAAARVCREAATVACNVLMRDINVDSWVQSCPTWYNAELHNDGLPHPQGSGIHLRCSPLFFPRSLMSTVPRSQCKARVQPTPYNIRLASGGAGWNPRGGRIGNFFPTRLFVRKRDWVPGQRAPRRPRRPPARAAAHQAWHQQQTAPPAAWQQAHFAGRQERAGNGVCKLRDGANKLVVPPPAGLAGQGAKPLRPLAQQPGVRSTLALLRDRTHGTVSRGSGGLGPVAQRASRPVQGCKGVDGCSAARTTCAHLCGPTGRRSCSCCRNAMSVRSGTIACCHQGVSTQNAW